MHLRIFARSIVGIYALLCFRVSGAAELSEAEASSTSAAIWNSELQGDRVHEIQLASAFAKVTHPEWAAPWAKGVLYRLNSIGKPIEMTFTAVDDRRCDLREMRGKVVLINFWATWCPPCVEDMPKLGQLYSKYHAQGLEVVGISWDSDKAELVHFIDKNQIKWPIYFDGTKPGKWGTAFGIGGVPYVLIVDRQGILIYCSADENAAMEVEIPRLMSEPHD